jgi:hypothetical protein
MTVFTTLYIMVTGILKEGEIPALASTSVISVSYTPIPAGKTEIMPAKLATA